MRTNLEYSSAEILKLVMSGRMGSAIEQTIRWYPGLLENNQNLMFMLKCRQFIEMVNGCDFDVSILRESWHGASIGLTWWFPQIPFRAPFRGRLRGKRR